MPKESVLTQPEIDSLKIERFIFHIIQTEEDEPHYLDEAQLDEEQIDFFTKRLVDVSKGTQYIFLDKDKSEVYRLCKKILTSEKTNFKKCSEELTASFRSQHRKQAIDGVFIISLVSIQNSRKLIFLLKLDHTKVYEYKTKGSKVVIEKIKNSFVEDKNAVQKIAIIDCNDHYIWNVLAQDKKAGKGKIIGDYFKGFLNVVERETDSVLTSKAINIVRQWAVSNKALCEPKSEPSAYKYRAITYLQQNETFDSDEFIKEVIKDDDISRKRNARKSLKSFLEEKGIAGQSFAPQNGAINKTIKKNTVKTAEGLIIQWEGDPSASNIEFSPTKDKNNMYTITIRTSEYININ